MAVDVKDGAVIGERGIVVDRRQRCEGRVRTYPCAKTTVVPAPGVRNRRSSARPGRGDG